MQQNFAAVDAALDHLREIAVPSKRRQATIELTSNVPVVSAGVRADK